MKHILNPPDAPAPIGPYNQAVKSGHLLYTSGQLPIDPATGDMVKGGIREQTIQVLENLKAVTEAAGTTLGDVIKTTVFLVDMAEFSQMNEVYVTFFPNKPARSAVGNVRLGLDARLEIECMAVID